MKLVVNIKLVPNTEQKQLLMETLKSANEACEYISQIAWDQQLFGQYGLHKIVYYDVKQRFNLTAQMVVRCIAKVADSYKKDTETQRHFRWNGAQPYDARLIRLKDDQASIWTLKGREKIPFVMGDDQRALFAYQKGEMDLMCIHNKWYLACVCDIPTPEEIGCTDVLGVDLGIVNIATDSNGKNYSGKQVNINRCIHAHRKQRLQKKGTKAAKRKLKTLAGKQARYQKDVNHCISKQIVQDAQRTGSKIALEDLGGIRKRVTAKRNQRARLANWGFHQLRTFITYKAQRVGIPVVLVDPRYTSQECPSCGHIANQNRRNRNEFQCVQCGTAGPADAIAARNIRARAAVNPPMVSEES
jgi:IS605 OrfB family transposase